MKFSNWIKQNKTNESVQLLERIFLDIINLFENSEDDKKNKLLYMKRSAENLTPEDIDRRAEQLLSHALKYWKI